MNTFEDLLRADLKSIGDAQSFAVDLDPVIADGHRVVRRRTLVPVAAATVLAIATAATLLTLRPWDQRAIPVATPTVSAPTRTLDAAAYGEFAQFASPSTRVACAMGSEAVVCNIPMGYALDLPPADEACEPGWESVTDVMLTDTGPIVLGCGTDTASLPYRYNEATAWAGSGFGTWTTSEYFGNEDVAVLPVGSTLELGDYRCTAEDDALTCTHTPSGHWMRVAPEGITEG